MDVVWLGTENAIDPREVGAKAAGIPRLLQLGFSTPGGFVVTVSAFRMFLETAGLCTKLEAVAGCTEAAELDLQLREVRAGIDRASLTPDVEQSVATAYRMLAGTVAVRSSGIVEDGEQSAFAGAYDSFLNRVGESEVLAAIRDCWRSAFSPRVAAYRLQHRLVGADWLMGVIVQTMVFADKAGVMFTRSPFEDRSTILVEAVLGGCDRIVSGAPGDLSLRVDRATGKLEYLEHARRVPQRFGTGALGLLGGSVLQGPKLLQKNEIEALVDTALRLEAAFHRPQDVEWAIANGQLVLLQTRPLTGLR